MARLDDERAASQPKDAPRAASAAPKHPADHGYREAPQSAVFFDRAVWLPASGMLGVVLAYVALGAVLVGEAQKAATQLVLVVVYLGVSVTFSWGALHTPLRRLRLAWLAWSAVWLSVCLGQVVSGFFLTPNQVAQPSPTLADVFYLPVYPFTVIALSAFPTVPVSRSHRLQSWLDGGILAGAVFGISWYFVLGPLVLKGNPSTLTLAAQLAYAIGNVGCASEF
jgi:hypothetical protein